MDLCWQSTIAGRIVLLMLVEGKQHHGGPGGHRPAAFQKQAAEF